MDNSFYEGPVRLRELGKCDMRSGQWPRSRDLELNLFYQQGRRDVESARQFEQEASIKRDVHSDCCFLSVEVE